MECGGKRRFGSSVGSANRRRIKSGAARRTPKRFAQCTEEARYVRSDRYDRYDRYDRRRPVGNGSAVRFV